MPNSIVMDLWSAKWHKNKVHAIPTTYIQPRMQLQGGERKLCLIVLSWTYGVPNGTKIRVGVSTDKIYTAAVKKRFHSVYLPACNAQSIAALPLPLLRSVLKVADSGIATSCMNIKARHLQMHKCGVACTCTCV